MFSSKKSFFEKIIPGRYLLNTNDKKVMALLEWFQLHNYINSKKKITVDEIDLFLGRKDQTYDPYFKIYDLLIGPTSYIFAGQRHALSKYEIYCQYYSSWYQQDIYGVKLFKISLSGKVILLQDLIEDRHL